MGEFFAAIKSAVMYIGIRTLILLMVTSMFWGYKAKAQVGVEGTRQAQYAGSWYEADPDILKLQLDTFLNQASPLIDKQKVSKLTAGDKPPAAPILAIVAPHAGYIYSGQAAAYAYKAVKNQHVNRIFLLGPSHRQAFRGAALPMAVTFKTPLGDLDVDKDIVTELKQYPLFATMPDVHREEHSLEMQLPLIKQVFADVKIVPIIVGVLPDQSEVQMLAAILKRYVGKDDLVIVSSDFTHFGPRYDYVPFKDNIKDNIRALDSRAYKNLSELNLSGFQQFEEETKDTICGFYPLSVLLAMLPPGSQASLLTYYTSQDIGQGAGYEDKDNSVSYLAIAFSGKSWADSMTKNSDAKLSQADKKTLLKLARATLTAYVKEKKVPTVEELGIDLSPALKEARGAFVTLYKYPSTVHGVTGNFSHADKQLRGCIGYIWPFQPLYKAVIENSVSACSRDPRFNSVQPEELDNILIDINVLTAPHRIASANDIVLGRDGIVFYKGGAQAVFLPSVPVDFGWDLAKTLSQLAKKAGLNEDDWREDARFDVFQSESFAESGAESD